MSLDKLIERGASLFKGLNFEILCKDKEVLENPFALVHPAYLYYIWGKFSKHFNASADSKECFTKALDIFEKQIKLAITASNYSDAGEFAILKLRTASRLDPKSELLKSSYKTAIKIVKSLYNVYKDPYYIDTFISVKTMNEKYSGVKLDEAKMESLYRKAAEKYLQEANSIKEEELVNIKITSLYEAANYLQKIKKTIIDADIEKKKSNLNKFIVEINKQIDLLNNYQIKIQEYSQRVLKIHFYHGLSKGYALLNEKKEAKFFLEKALTDLDKVFQDESLIPSLIKSKKILFKEEKMFKIQDIEIYSKEFFEKVIVLLEKIDLLDLKERILLDLKDLAEFNEELIKKEKDLPKLLVKLCDNLIDLFEKEIASETDKEKLTNLMKTKYLAFCIHMIYQIYKILNKK